MKEPPVVRRIPPPLAQQPPPQPSKWNFLLDSRPAMLGMLFGVTGFLGIPFLWMSRRFSRREKIVWSIVVTIYTCALIGIAVAICWWSYSRIAHLLN